VAGHFRIGLADVRQRDPQAVRLIPEGVARRYGILGVSLTERSVVVATSDPANERAHRAIVEHAGRQPIYLLANPAALAEALDHAYAPRQAPRNSLEHLVAEVAKSDFQVVTSDGRGMFTSFELEDPVVVRLADVILQQGVRYRATEIHIEAGRVRYRIVGVLQHVVGLPAAAYGQLVARLKHAAQAAAVRSEEGLVIRAGNVERVGHLLTTPTPDGELVSLRLISPNDVPTMDRLSFEGAEREAIQGIIGRREGLVLVTGPARSGITSFIYASLHALSKRSVLSLEGRIELRVPGVTQIRYDASQGISFAETLQQLLERGPDVVHAGELRDQATARIALRTAVTGRKGCSRPLIHRTPCPACGACSTSGLRLDASRSPCTPSFPCVWFAGSARIARTPCRWPTTCHPESASLPACSESSRPNARWGARRARAPDISANCSASCRFGRRRRGQPVPSS
jgi:type II secretory ATPase GspE/PulE/Tfp pilus assembly ATPase PilB-like protein